MIFTIVGWYGTETIGDRAILSGIIDILKDFDKHIDIKIGSLYPFYTERALLEDKAFNKVIANNVKISCFDIRDKKISKSIIKESKLVIMGGGPLTNILELDYIESSFRYAKKNQIPTGLVGVGIGPIGGRCFRKRIASIIKYSDFIITRDLISKEIILSEFRRDDEVYVSDDPAILPTYYVESVDEKYCDYVVVNLRRFPFENADKINKHIEEFLSNLAKTSKEKILLLSNHYFFIGGDDREFYYDLQSKIKSKNIEIQSAPLSLYDTLKIIKSAKLCIGMRYHSILFHTFLNGNNYILDYTGKKGKIEAFIDSLNATDFYNGRKINLLDISREMDRAFEYSECKNNLNLEERKNKCIKYYQKVIEQYL